MPEYSERYQKLIDKFGLEELRRISLERCHRSRIKHGTLSPDGPHKPMTREEKLAKRRGWAEKNRGHLREYAKAHYEKHAGKIRAEMSERYRKNPEKWQASQKARDALKAGRIVKPQHCTKCGKERFRLEMHHTDYTKPLLIQWLCRSCHRQLHATMRGHVPRGRTANDEVARAKQAARRVFHRALGSGEVTKPDSCQRCGSLETIEAHHGDYSKPLDVEWLCRDCHRGLGHKKSNLRGTAPQVRGAPLQHSAE